MLCYMLYIFPSTYGKGLSLQLYCVPKLLVPHLLGKTNWMLVLSYPFVHVRFLHVQIVVEMVKSFLNTVGNALEKDVFALRKVLK